MYRLDELLGTGDLHLLGPGAMWIHVVPRIRGYRRKPYMVLGALAGCDFPSIEHQLMGF